jgi:hypothetical protein
MVLRSLKDAKFLSFLPLEAVQSAEIELTDLEMEVCDELVILNGIPFKPVERNAVGASRGRNCTLSMLKGVCVKLCDMSKSDLTSDELYHRLVLRLAKTTASAGPHLRLNSLLCSSDIFIMPLSSENTQPEKAPRSKALQELMAQKEAPQATQPIHLNVYEANGDLHVTINQTHKFGLFRNKDSKSGRAWIGIDAVVGERANMSTAKSVRSMNVKLPELY